MVQGEGEEMMGTMKILGLLNDDDGLDPPFSALLYFIP